MVSAMNLFNRKHRRSPSHFNLKYGRENSPPDSPVKEQKGGSPSHIGYLQLQQDELPAKDEIEVILKYIIYLLEMSSFFLCCQEII